MPDHDICPRNKNESIKYQINIGSKYGEIIEENIWKNINRIRSQQIREFSVIQPRKRRREWEEDVTRMNAERLVKISRHNIPSRTSERKMEGLNHWLIHKNKKILV